MAEEFELIIIPCLNPDGVYYGNYRTDTRGQNLNRFYDQSDFQRFPVNIAYNMLVQLHSQRIFMIIDLHNHASLQSVVLFGNDVF